MYSKNYSTGTYERKKQTEIPVQSFGDSFSADAYISSEARNTDDQYGNIKEPDGIPDDCETKNALYENRENTISKRTGIKPDDLVLIALILLFMFDKCEKNDIMIPVLLGIILLS